MPKLAHEIGRLCPPDLYEVGYASLSGLLNSPYSKYLFGISLARKLDDAILDEIASGPTESYLELYHSVNNELNSKTHEIAELLKENNIDALPVKATVDDKELDAEYWKTLRYSFSHKMVATRAGIGWIGKTDLLISKRFGPRVRLASILTSERVAETGDPIDKSRCGRCRICVERCPAKAATGKMWSIAVDRNEFFDPFKCREHCLQISSKNLKRKITLCGICVSVCPKGRKRLDKGSA